MKEEKSSAIQDLEKMKQKVIEVEAEATRAATKVRGDT
jgi:hypothetical protein